MNAPFVLTRAQSRFVDVIAVRDYGMSGAVLMENAGRGVVEELLGIDPALARGGRVAILCGKGNNASDGFVIARHLEIRGAVPTVLLLCPPDELAGDAAMNYGILGRAGAALVDLSPFAGETPRRLAEQLARHAAGAAWLVDAMLGTGATGPPREPFRTAIAWMNAHPARRLAVDVPSGLDCDTGEVADVAVRADVTCTFVAAKPGLVGEAAAAWVGELRVVGIGVPTRLVAEIAAIG